MGLLAWQPSYPSLSRASVATQAGYAVWVGVIGNKAKTRAKQSLETGKDGALGMIWVSDPKQVYLGCLLQLPSLANWVGVVGISCSSSRSLLAIPFLCSGIPFHKLERALRLPLSV